MTPNQLERMRKLEEKLADVVLDEADPDSWPGKSKSLADLTAGERGDRYWCKKNAAASFALLARCSVFVTGAPSSGDDDEVSIDKQIAKREAEAQRLLDTTLNQARKSSFDEKIRGKR